MNTLVLLARHGVTPTTGQVLPGRAPGLHLSDAGAQQAARLAERLADLPVAALYTSPLERTRETAAPTAERFGLPLVEHDGLLECDFGAWTGRALTELSALPEWEQVQRTPSTFRFPDGESFTEMQQRIVAAIQGVAAQHPDAVVVCFSHADPIKAALNWALGAPLDAFQRLWVNPASVSAIVFDDSGQPGVLVMNSTAGSLSELRPRRPE